MEYSCVFVTFQNGITIHKHDVNHHRYTTYSVLICRAVAVKPPSEKPAALAHKSVKDLVLDLVKEKLQELENKGLLPRWKMN